MPERIERRGARVHLRTPTVDDWPEYALSAEASRRHLRPWVYLPATETAFARWVARAEAATHRFFFVCGRGGEIMGAVNLNEIVRGCLHGCFMGYYLFAEYAGRGYMTEAMGIVLDHAFNELKLHRLEANIQPGNTESIALVRRLGFRLEGFSPRYLKIGGRWCDHERWAIAVEDWRRCRRSVVSRRRPT